MKNWLINKLGGVTLEEFRQAQEKWTDKVVLTAAVKDLYNTIGADDILREVNGVWFVGDKVLEESTRDLLISEAKTILNTKLWKYLKKDIQYQANKSMYINSKTDIDLVAGKLWLYTLDALETRLGSLKKGSGRFNK